jgi:hypothetical protein
MAAFPTTFEVRQFCNIPSEDLPFDNGNPQILLLLQVPLVTF